MMQVICQCLEEIHCNGIFKSMSEIYDVHGTCLGSDFVLYCPLLSI